MTKNSKLNREDLSPSLIFKKYRMRFHYHFRNFWRRLWFKFPIILFVISLFLFLSILIPNIVLHKMPILGEWPIILELDGIVLREAKDYKASEFIGVTGATVEIGGYKSMTNQDGKFHIKFVSKSHSDVPVIIQLPNKTIIKRVSFDSNQFKKTEVFIINDG